MHENDMFDRLADLEDMENRTTKEEAELIWLRETTESLEKEYMEQMKGEVK